MVNQNTDHQDNKQTTTSVKKKKPSKIARFILKHKVSFSLFFALVVVFIWAQCTINGLTKVAIAKEIEHQKKMDSITVVHYRLVSDVFSWTVRSDLLRNNMDQASQHVNNIVHKEHIKKAYIIDLASHTIILSSNPTDVGMPVSDVTLLRVAPSETQINETTKRFTSPITGLSSIIGISVIETDIK